MTSAVSLRDVFLLFRRLRCPVLCLAMYRYVWLDGDVSFVLCGAAFTVAASGNRTTQHLDSRTARLDNK